MVKKAIKNLFLNISIAVIVVFLFLAIFEVILSQRFIKNNDLVNQLFKESVVDGDTPYKPNAYVVFEGGVGSPRLDPTIIKINSQGLRDYEHSVEKPVNTFRILGFGDSITWGHGVELDQAYLKVLEKKLNSLNSSVNYEVINFGVGGYNTQQAVKLLKMKGLAYKPDMVIFLCSPNDAKLGEQIGVSNNTEVTKGATLGNSHISSWVYTKIYNSEVKEAVSKGEENPHEFWSLIEPSLIELQQMAVENNFTVVLLILPTIVLADEYEKFALENGFYTASFYGHPESNPQPVEHTQRSILKDGHPNPFGHEIAAEELYKTLINKSLVPVKEK